MVGVAGSGHTGQGGIMMIKSRVRDAMRRVG
jgi:hypothetical protein